MDTHNPSTCRPLWLAFVLSFCWDLSIDVVDIHIVNVARCLCTSSIGGYPCRAPWWQNNTADVWCTWLPSNVPLVSAIYYRTVYIWTGGKDRPSACPDSAAAWISYRQPEPEKPKYNSNSFVSKSMWLSVCPWVSTLLPWKAHLK